MSEHAIVMAKWPLRGKVKTRMADHTSEDFAFEVYQKLFDYTLRFWKQSPFDTTLCLDAAPYLPESRLRCKPQSPGHLGARMHAAVLEEMEAGSEKIVVVGTDCPALTHDLIKRAFNVLDYADVVLGPALDGGYYLIGVSRDCPELFGPLNWGTSGILSDSIAICRAHGYSVVTLCMLRDLDTFEDLRALLGMKDVGMPDHEEILRSLSSLLGSMSETQG
ncbi:MAG: TIGR04282 family arsenosugar biosynthesis glycosyltransferase [Flavobacteriales bacterium]|nr:TIGR04282 family arsenosugar biosynthesis glycosyltransferase [Flavobacteriales bacterium]